MKLGKKLAFALCVLCLSTAAAAMTACGTPVDTGKNPASDSVSGSDASTNESTSPDESTSTPDGSSSETHTHHYVGGVCECGEQEPNFTGDAIGYKIAGGVYTGKMTGGVPDGAGVLTYDDGNVLTAEFQGGTYTAGKMEYASGDVYEGGFNAEGKYEGEGRYTFATGMYYEGEYVNGKREGEGMFTWSTDGNLENGWLFEGTFKDDKASYGRTTTTKTEGFIWYEGYMTDLNDVDESKPGQGFFDYANGCTYTGEMYARGALDSCTFDGEGKFVWPGSDFAGTWKDGVPLSGVKTFYAEAENKTVSEVYEGEVNGAYVFHGNGKMTYKSGDVYAGEFADGKYEGLGRYTFANGMYYEGEYVKGVREGEGLFTWSTDGNLENGWLFEGTFKAGKAYYGKTTTHNPTGLQWYEGYMHDLNDVDASKPGKGYVYFSDSKCTYTGGMYSSGALATAVYDGEGTFTWPGSDIVGTWSQGAPVSGRKTFYKENENVTPNNYYEGTFKNWNYEGKGKFDYLNGCWYEGDFVNGVFEGEGTFSWNTELGKDTYIVGTFANGTAVSGTKYWPTRKTGLLQYTGKFANTDNIDVAAAGSGKYLFENGDVYEGGLQATAANGSACTLTGTGTLTYAAPAVTGADLGLEGDAAAYKAAMVYGEFTAGAVKGSAVYFLVDAEGVPAGYVTGTYEGKTRTGAAAEEFTYTLPAEYDGTADYTPAENAA